MTEMRNRTSPNILITGLAGVGKSTLCCKLSKQTGLEWLEVSRIIAKNNFEKSNQSLLVKERILNCIEEKINSGGNIVDYCFCELLPQEWFDIVIVLRADNSMLYERCNNKFDSENIYELNNATWREFDENLKTIRMWLQRWYVTKEELHNKIIWQVFND